jgi:hypothetical protein
MAVLSFREVLPRTFQQRFGESPTAARKFVVTLDEPTPSAQIISAVGILFGAPHPEYFYLRMLDGQVNETDRHHAEVTYNYELPDQEDLDPNPLARPDRWSFSVGGAQVPALAYFHGSGNNDIRPLVTAAGDFFEGLTTAEAEVRASISSNRPTFDLALAANITNAINESPYLGGPQYSWQCSGINGNQAVEVVNDVEIRYWQITVELVFRRSGWVMKLPHVGFHFIEDGKKRRAWAWNEAGDEKVEAASPQPLDENGGLKFPGAGGNPDQLSRRVFPAVNFSQYFGTPPF